MCRIATQIKLVDLAFSGAYLKDRDRAESSSPCARSCTMPKAQPTTLQQYTDYLRAQCTVVSRTGTDVRWKCLFCDHPFSGATIRIRKHLLCIGDVRGCPLCPEEVKDEILLLTSQLPRKKRRVNQENLDDALDVAVEQSVQQGRQVGIKEAMSAAGKVGVDQALTDLFCEAGISLNVIR